MRWSRRWRGWPLNEVEPNVEGLAIEWGGAECGWGWLLNEAEPNVEGLAIEWGGAKCGKVGYWMRWSQMWKGWLLNEVELNMEGLAIEWGGDKCGGAGCWMGWSQIWRVWLLNGVEPNVEGLAINLPHAKWLCWSLGSSQTWEASCQSVSRKMKLMKGVDLGRHS